MTNSNTDKLKVIFLEALALCGANQARIVQLTWIHTKDLLQALIPNSWIIHLLLELEMLLAQLRVTSYQTTIKSEKAKNI